MNKVYTSDQNAKDLKKYFSKKRVERVKSLKMFFEEVEREYYANLSDNRNSNKR